MLRMRFRSSRVLLTGAVFAMLGMSAAGCLSDSSPTSPGTPPAASPPAAATAPVDTRPIDPTAVPVPDTPGPTEEPEPMPTRLGVTDTPWGAIIDQVPGDWPVFPGAEPVEPGEGPASGAWLAPEVPGTVAGWYRDALAGLGFTSMDLSSPLEDGTQVLDIVTDLPECRIQVTFGPAGGSTMVTVLYGAGCAGGDG
jgi:hypothetical protein